MKQANATILDPQVQTMLDHFCVLLSIRIAFISTDGDELATGGNWRSCRYCRYLRERLGFEHKCRALDMAMFTQTSQTKQLVSYECHAGLSEAVMPVYLYEELLGFVMIGQYRCRKKMPASIRKQWSERYKTEQLARAFEITPYLTPVRKEHVLGLVQVLADHIVSRHMVRFGSDGILRPVLEHMQQNLYRNVSLAEAAAIVHRSPHTLSHMFAKLLNRSFKQVQIDMKLDKAQELLRSPEGTTVKEVAYQLGYRDPLYFSRLFRKHRGMAPSQYAKYRPSVA